jgi:hypothetical protein
MHVVEAQTAAGQRIDVWRFDWAAIATHLSESSIVLHDEQNIGRAFAGS